MPIIPKILIGRLDYDSSPHLVAKEDFIDGLNITREQGSGGTFNDDSVVANVKGNRFVPFNLPLYGNKTIGARQDPLRNAIYYFIYNSDGFHTIAYYDNATRVISKIFQSKTDSAGVDIFQWNPEFSIIHVDIVHRDIEGDLLYWVDPVPRKLNIKTALAGGYAGVTSQDMKAAKAQPAIQITAEYISDANIILNNLSGKLFEFDYRYVYDDFEKSTFSSLSANPLPGNDYEENINPLANNVINVTVNTGGAYVKKVEVAFRQNIGNLWSDYFLIVSLDKEQLFLADNSTYTLPFTNDGAYIPIDVNEAIQLFDYVPLEAKAQCMPNGANIVYGAITEGYPNMTDLNVVATVTYETVPLPSGSIVIGNPSFSFVVLTLGRGFECTVGATVTPGDEYQIIGSKVGPTVNFDFTYTAMLGDTNLDIVTYFVTQINTVSFVGATDIGGGKFQVLFFGGSANATLSTTAIAATANAGGNFFDRIYKLGGKFRFGQLYFDENGITPGVQTYIGAAGSTSDYEVEIDNFNAFDTAYKRPIVNITVQHLPPSWAKSFSFVRTKNLRVETFFSFKTDEVQDDGSFFYFGIDELEAYEAATPNFSSKWTFQSGDRLTANYYFNGTSDTGWGALYNPVLDYEIVGVVEKDFGGGDKTYIKIKKYPGSIAPFGTYDNDTVFEVYRPALRTDGTLQVYYEFGERYPTVEIDGIVYHQGQNATTNPTFSFSDGDIYLRMRSGLGEDYLIQDPNFSDFFASAVNSNGRAFVIDENASQTYNPVLVRFSQSYQFGTNLNGLNRFFPENFDEYNRAYGDILKLDTYASYMKVGQTLRIGNVPVYLQIVKDQTGGDNLTISDKLINQIVYYQGDFGVGTVPESWARNNFVAYFCDNIRGVVCRLSQDGITPLSIIYNVNSWATTQLPLRNGTTSKIFGVYNAAVNRYEMHLEIALQPNLLSVGIQDKFGIENECILSNSLVDICDGGITTLYTGTLIDTGIVVYYDSDLTANVSGFSYIAVNGAIYNLDPATGELGAFTGNTCGTGTSGTYRLDTVLANICDNPTVTLYTNGAFAIGQILYYDSALAVPVTGFDFVSTTANDIYDIDSGTGEVLSDTGSDCGGGTGASYKLSTTLATVCAAPTVTLYTSGAFMIGSIMYTDSSLTTPVTGSNYIVQVSTNDIYNLDSGTGEVLSDTTNDCGIGTGASYRLGNDIYTVCAQSLQTLYTNGAFMVGSILYTDSSLTNAVTGSTYVVQESSEDIYNLNTGTGEVGALAGTCDPAYNVFFENNVSGASIDGSTVSGASWFLVDTGAFPLTNGQSLTGTHGGLTGAIAVQISGAFAASNLKIYVNSVQEQCLNVSGAGTYTFASDSYSSTALISIILSTGSC